MSSIDDHQSVRLSDGRKRALRLAACEANRQGVTMEQALRDLAGKSIEVDGQAPQIANGIIEGVYKRYASEHGTSRSGGQLIRVKEGIDYKILDLDLHFEPLPVTELSPAEQCRHFIEAVFQPGDYINFDTDPQLGDDGRCTPRVGALATYERLLESLTEDGDARLLRAIETSENGAFVRINPVTSFLGAKTANDVTDHRHTLIESDSMELEHQWATLRALNLPIRAVVHSGNKSLHAVVRIDAGRNYHLYKQRVEFLHSVLDMALIRVDKAVKDASRWTRLPGFRRADGR